MARPQSYDRDQVLENTMQVFWRKGYARTSVKDLTNATNLQPGSLYGAFNSKRSIFINSVEYYFDELYQDAISIFRSKADPIRRIRQFFDFLIQRISSDVDNKSCMLVNTLLELPAEEDEIRQNVIKMLKLFETEITQLLIESQQKGTLVNGARPEVVAKMLMSSVFGIQVYSHMQPAIEDLRQIVNNLISPIEK